MPKIVYYITAHGYGHGTRSCDIINALHAAAPGGEMMVRTDLPEAFLRGRLESDARIVPGALDAGLVQKDAIRVDLDASLQAVESIHARSEELINEESDFLTNNEIDVVVADIPALPLVAARRAGIPAIATGNFGWDWIYEDYIGYDHRWSRHADFIRSAYRETDLLLRQPFAEPMAAFPNVIDIPLLARPGTACREKIAAATGADPDRRWLLLAFTALEMDAAALARIPHLRRCETFSVEPLAWPGSGIHCLKRSLAGFSDTLASMDAVVTKPGFGIVSECIANDRPIIYTDREDFREYEVLVEGIEKYCRYTYLPSSDLYAGRLEAALDRLESAPPPRDKIAFGGAEIAAQHILTAANR